MNHVNHNHCLATKGNVINTSDYLGYTTKQTHPLPSTLIYVTQYKLLT